MSELLSVIIDRDAARDYYFPHRRTPTTSTMPPERRLFVWFRHKMAAQALLADMLGDGPRLITVHEAAQLRGLPVLNPGTWIEITNHGYIVPEQIKHQVKVSGLVVMELNDQWCREKLIAEIKDFVNVDWSLPIETCETPPRPARIVSGETGGAIDYVRVKIDGGDFSQTYNHPPGVYAASKLCGHVRGNLSVRNVRTDAYSAIAPDDLT